MQAAIPRPVRATITAPFGRPPVLYVVRLSSVTRPQHPQAPQLIRDYVSWGCGPRAAQLTESAVFAQVWAGPVSELRHLAHRQPLTCRFRRPSATEHALFGANRGGLRPLTPIAERRDRDAEAQRGKMRCADDVGDRGERRVGLARHCSPADCLVRGKHVLRCRAKFFGRKPRMVCYDIVRPTDGRGPGCNR